LKLNNPLRSFEVLDFHVIVLVKMNGHRSKRAKYLVFKVYEYSAKQTVVGDGVAKCQRMQNMTADNAMP
jgi:hypothetical protein